MKIIDNPSENMPDASSTPKDRSDKTLRLRAEEHSLKEGDFSQKNLEEMSSEEMRRTIHELQVYRIELEMQNEELRKTELELYDARARYFDLYEMAPLGYLILSLTGLILEANLTAVTLLGVNRVALIKQPFSQLILKEDQDRHYLNSRQLFEKGEPQDYELRMVKKDGTVFWIHLAATAAKDNGELICRVALSDITRLKQTEEALRESEEKFRLLYTSMDQGLGLHEIITNSEGEPVDYIFLDINDSYTKILGITREMAIGKRITEVMPFIEQYWIDVFGKVALTGEPSYYENYMETTGKYYSTYTYCPKKNQFAVLVSDISERIQKDEKILYLSYHDQLTGLYNRRFYEEELKRLDTERNLPLTLVMGDVNGLKLVNDSFGHVMGDELLKKIAEIIKNSCRIDDIVARLGGDEFIIILPQTDTLETEKVIARMKELALKEKVGSLDISISFGYKTKTDKTEDIHNIFKAAEDSMYRNKLSESASIRHKTIDLVMKTLYEKNHREMLHSKRVSEICEAIAIQMNLHPDAVDQIRIAGLMHDIGKIGIDENILNSNRKLSNDEWKEIRRHSEIGFRILSSANEFSEIAVFVLENHERWDGKGYPKGLKGVEISLAASIIAVADAYDAMTSERSYKKALSEEEAIKEIKRCVGTHFDPKIVRVFIEKVLGKPWLST
ncbi:diguanylate cyclase [Acetobacterium sp.]|uniref:diguanylate cyclase n=1 Tax=Acetobacterium sp. TaxID=1872094 RepID=UPI002F42F84F